MAKKRAPPKKRKRSDDVGDAESSKRAREQDQPEQDQPPAAATGTRPRATIKLTTRAKSVAGEYFPSHKSIDKLAKLRVPTLEEYQLPAESAAYKNNASTYPKSSAIRDLRLPLHGGYQNLSAAPGFSPPGWYSNAGDRYNYVEPESEYQDAQRSVKMQKAKDQRLHGQTLAYALSADPPAGADMAAILGYQSPKALAQHTDNERESIPARSPLLDFIPAGANPAAKSCPRSPNRPASRSIDGSAGWPISYPQAQIRQQNRARGHQIGQPAGRLTARLADCDRGHQIGSSGDANPWQSWTYSDPWWLGNRTGTCPRRT